MSAPSRSPAFTFDPVTLRYRNARGQFISAQQVHGYVQEYSSNVGKALRTLTEQLRAGSMTLPEWQLAMMQEVKAAHLATAMAAKGGRAQMTQSDYGRVGQLIKENYQYLSRLADGIADGSIPLDGHVLLRAEQYGKAARETYANIDRREQQRRGKSEERNVRSKSDSCEAGDRPGCIEETERGWQPIGSISLPGSRTCLHSCGCRIEYR